MENLLSILNVEETEKPPPVKSSKKTANPNDTSPDEVRHDFNTKFVVQWGLQGFLKPTDTVDFVLEVIINFLRKVNCYGFFRVRLRRVFRLLKIVSRAFRKRRARRLADIEKCVATWKAVLHAKRSSLRESLAADVLRNTKHRFNRTMEQWVQLQLPDATKNKAVTALWWKKWDEFYKQFQPKFQLVQDAEAQIVDLQRQLAAQPPGPKAEKVQADLRSRLLAARSHKAALESRLPTFSFEPGFAECMAIAKQFPIRPAPDGAERPGAPEDAAAAAAAPAFPTSPASGSGSTPDTSPRRLAPPAALTPGKQPQSAAQGGSPAPGRAAQALSPGKMLRFPFLAPGPAPPSPSTPGAGSPGAPLLKSPGQRPTRIVTSPPPPPLTRDELTSPIVFRCDADRALPDAGLGSDDEPGPRVGTPMSPASGGESPTRWRPASGGESPTFSRPRSRGRRAHPRALAASADNHRALSSLPRKRRENSVGLLQLPLVSPESVAMPDIGEIIQKKSWCAGQFSRERDRDMLKFRAATP